jgi:hypothetical protein
MEEIKFDYKYFLETLMQRILYIAMNLPATYTSLLAVFIVWLIQPADGDIILYAAVVLGFILKIAFTMGSKHKQIVSEVFVIGIDLAFGLLIVLINGVIVEYTILIGTILYLLWYSYINTISYTRLGHNTEEILKDLKIRHEKKPPKKQ